MALELVFLGAATSVAALALWALAGVSIAARSELVSERAAFWSVVGPVLGAGLAFAFFAGWAIQEPDPSDEWIDRGLFIVAAIVGLVTARAVLRALTSLFGKADVPVGTVGLLRPSVRVTRAFREAVDDETLEAAVAHEEAHRRCYDPLRIWLLALATDLQWPVPGARARFERWLHALEMARDDEALAHGATPGGLASAILAAARLHGARRRTAAAVAGTERGLALRVRRLLRGDAKPRVPSGGRRALALVCAALVAACWLGHAWGEVVLGVLPGVGR